MSADTSMPEPSPVVVTFTTETAAVAVNELFRRPTLYPSVWQTGSCKAHFFVRKGQLICCDDF
jgi:Family of unknown function (DUF6527)